MNQIAKRLFTSGFFRSGIFKLAVKAGLTIVAFWFVFQGVDFDHLADILKQQDHVQLLIAAILVIFQSMLGAGRWRLIINSLADAREHRITLYSSMKIYYVGVFFTCCLPGTVGGDVVRVWMAKNENIPLPIAINSVIIDRMIALFAIGVMVVLTLPVIADAAGFNSLPIYPLIAIATAFGIYLIYNLDRLLHRFKHIRLINWFLYFIRSLRIILSHKRSSFISLMLALIAHVSYCIAAYIMAHSLGINLSIIHSLTFLPLIMLVTTIPISIGGWGVREAVMVWLLGLVGVSQAAALMLSIQLGLIIIILSLPASLLWLTHRKTVQQVSVTEAVPLGVQEP
jgi:glycosyltransferase 2 family protein